MADRYNDRERVWRPYNEEEARYGRAYGRGYGRYGCESEYGEYGPSYRFSRRYGDPFRRETEYDAEWSDTSRRPEDDYDTFAYEAPWLIPGPYTGRGPRGYRRSDERIMEDVCDRLTQHGQLDASGIAVDVNDGEVALKGSVNSRRAKRMAEAVAESVNGVWDVNNQLRVSESRWSRQGAEPDQEMGASRTTRGRIGASDTQIYTGMAVVGSDGQSIGQVKEVRGNDFLVDRPIARDVYAPMSACRMVSGDQVTLNVRSDEVDSQGWPNPELLAGNSETDSQRRRL
jgi:hypothetical protein